MHLKYTAIFLFSLFILESCSKKETVGLFTNGDLNKLSVEYVDTFTVKTSTVAMDSLPTFDKKNDQIILAGSYVDPVLGIVKAQPYFQVSLNNTSFDLSNQIGLSYDSLALVLYYNSNPLTKPSGGITNAYYPYAGDTNQVQTLSLYRLNRNYQLFKLKNEIAPPGQPPAQQLPFFYNLLDPATYVDNYGNQNGYLFNTSNQGYDALSPISKVSFYPRPRSTSVGRPSSTGGSLNDSIVFKLPDSIASAFFKGALARDPRFQVSSLNDPNSNIAPDGAFVNYLKGLTIVTSSKNSAILSFDPTKSHLRLYYKSPQNGILKIAYRDFNISNNSTLYNNIKTDRTGTVLNGIKPFVPVPSEKTGNQSFVQSGSGLMTRIEFPYLYTFQQSHPNLTINRAELIIHTGLNSITSQTPTLPWLTLYRTDRTNYPLVPLRVDFTSSTQISPVQINPALSEVGSYHYFLIQFSQELLNKSYNDGTAILIGPPEIPMDNSVGRVILGNMNNISSPIRLRLYYSKISTN